MLLASSYKSYVIDLLAYWFKVETVTTIAFKTFVTLILGLSTLRLYVQI